MSRLPLRILSNASACPSLDNAGRTYGRGGSGTMPRPAASCLMIAGVMRSVADDAASLLREAVATRGAVGRSEQPMIVMARVATAADIIQVFGNIEPPTRL